MTALLTILIVVATLSPLWGQGYRLSSSEVVVNTLRLWQEWSFAEGTLQFQSDGSVQVSRLRSNTNAVFDIVEAMRLHAPSSVMPMPSSW